jgi:hypothetical protein
MAIKNKDEKELLTLAIDELRRHYDNVNDSFNHLRTKALALLVGEVAIITFIFSSPGLVMPKIVYGIIFLATGVALLIISFVLFLAVLSSASWCHPPDTNITKRLQKFFDSPVEFLIYMKDDYEDCIVKCIGIVGIRSSRFMWAVYAFSIGTLMLVVIKYGGGIMVL